MYGKKVKVKVAHTQLPSVGFRNWSRFLAVSLQMTWIINPTVGCHYFPPGTMGVNRLPKTVTRQRRDCNFNPGPSAPESSMLTTRLLSDVRLLCASLSGDLFDELATQLKLLWSPTALCHQLKTFLPADARKPTDGRSVMHRQFVWLYLYNTNDSIQITTMPHHQVCVRLHNFIGW